MSYQVIRPVTMLPAESGEGDDGLLASSNVTEADVTEWSAGTYAQGDQRMITTWANSATLVTHKIYESTAASNTTDPSDRETYVDGDGVTQFWWNEVSSTNRWKMFDDIPQDQTSNADSIEVDIDADAFVNSFALINVEAAHFYFNMRDTLSSHSNLLTYTEQFDNAAWSKTNSSISANSVASPDGTVTADTYTASATSSNDFRCSQSGGITVLNQLYTGSIYLSYSNSQYAVVILTEGFSTTAWANVVVDVKNGIILSTNNGAVAQNVASSIEEIHAGWYRVSITCSFSTVGSSVSLRYALSNTSTPSFSNYSLFSSAITMAGTEELYVWGGQLETGSEATDYVRVAAAGNGDQLVYNFRGSLISTEGINDWYKYYYEPVLKLSDYVVFGLPNVLTAEIEVLINDSGNTVKCGGLILGPAATLGDTLSKPNLSITNYSTKSVDADGRATITSRGFRKDMDAKVLMDTSTFAGVQKTMIDLLDTPAVWVADFDNAGTIVYGIHVGFDTMPYDDLTTVSQIEVEGLIT